MRRSATSLSIAEPCTEAWQHMAPTDAGRHCAACQTVVVDFTTMSDAEILRFLGQNPAAACGRFTDDQLDRTLRHPPAPTPRWRTWLAAAATVLGLREMGALEGQAQKTNQEVADIPCPHFAPAPALTDRPDELARQETTAQLLAAMAAPGGSIGLRGTVHNRWGIPLANVRISLPGQPEFQTTTNALGHFYLDIPAALVTSETELRVSRRWYRGQWVRIDSSPSRRYHTFLKKGRRRVISGRFR